MLAATAYRALLCLRRKHAMRWFVAWWVVAWVAAALAPCAEAFGRLSKTGPAEHAAHQHHHERPGASAPDHHTQDESAAHCLQLTDLDAAPLTAAGRITSLLDQLEPSVSTRPASVVQLAPAGSTLPYFHYPPPPPAHPYLRWLRLLI